MRNLIEKLRGNTLITDYKINIHQKESCELFFVKGKLETLRRTDTCDREVTVYVRHGEFLGDARFILYPSTTQEQLDTMIREAAAKALLINNPPYELPQGGEGSYRVPSNLAERELMDLAAVVAALVFESNTAPNADLNSVEVFLNKHTERVLNSRGVDRTQVRYDGMLETIPTYNGEKESVELYHQYNFSTLDPDAVREQIQRKLEEVTARSQAVTPEAVVPCKVILCGLEVAELMHSIAQDLHYAGVYSHRNLFKKGDAIQKAPTGDKISITMAGKAEGCVRSAEFDSDGLLLGSLQVVRDGVAVNYYGGNRYGQYLGETPTGELRCMVVSPGSAQAGEITAGAYLEVLSMSGLQVDFFNDYIGGEVRLAYYNDGQTRRPVTGISISGKLSEVLETILLSRETGVEGSYTGPRQAVLESMKIF